MNEKKIKQRRTEIRRVLKSRGLSDDGIAILTPEIENTVFAENKLECARTELLEEPLTEKWSNGKGQGGIRESSKWKAYESLWKSYNQGLQKILDAIPSGKVDVEKIESPKTTLERIRERHRKEA